MFESPLPFCVQTAPGTSHGRPGVIPMPTLASRDAGVTVSSHPWLLPCVRRRTRITVAPVISSTWSRMVGQVIAMFSLKCSSTVNASPSCVSGTFSNRPVNRLPAGAATSEVTPVRQSAPVPPCTVRTKRAVDALMVTGKDAVFWDRDLPGFGVRVYASGRKVFVVQFRANGRLRPA